jgi:hypothetical protein
MRRLSTPVPLQCAGKSSPKEALTARVSDTRQLNLLPNPRGLPERTESSKREKTADLGYAERNSPGRHAGRKCIEIGRFELFVLRSLLFGHRALLTAFLPLLPPTRHGTHCRALAKIREPTRTGPLGFR